MDEFEYKLVDDYFVRSEFSSKLSVGKLNDLGRQGWELVMKADDKYIFKRKLPPRGVDE